MKTKRGSAEDYVRWLGIPFWSGCALSYEAAGIEGRPPLPDPEPEEGDTNCAESAQFVSLSDDGNKAAPGAAFTSLPD